MATGLALIEVEVSIQGATDWPIHRAPPPIRFAPGGSENGVQQRVAIGAGLFQAFVPPTGARYVYMDLGTAPSLLLKGVTGDVGWPLTPATNVLHSIVILPTGTLVGQGITNGGSASATIELIWF